MTHEEQLYQKDLIIQKLEQQLAEKEKENKLLRDVLDNLKGDKASQKLVEAVNAVYEPLLEQRDALIRKQVCDKIKNLIDICFDAIETTNENGTKYSKEFSFKKFNAIINAIEQGEQQ